MTFTAEYGAFNIEASFNTFFRTNITANFPATWGDRDYFSASGVNFNYPTQNLVYPCFTVTHLGNVPQPVDVAVGIGGSAVNMKSCVVDVSCWASRVNTAGEENAAVRRDVMQMRDMAVSVMMSAKNSVPILDFYAGGLTAAGTIGLLRLRSLDESTPPEPDANIRRKRIVASYDFQELWRPN